MTTMTSAPVPFTSTVAGQWFVALNTAALIAFAAHLVEEQYRGAMDAMIWLMVAPIVIALLVGLVFSYASHGWAVGMVLGADLWVAIVVGYLHLNPASPDFVGAIYGAYASTTTGFLAAAIAIALWVVAAIALVQGVWTLTKVERHPFRRGVPVYR